MKVEAVENSQRSLGGRGDGPGYGVKVYRVTLPLTPLDRGRVPFCYFLTPGLCPAWHGIQVCYHWITAETGTIPPLGPGHTW